MNNLSNNLRNLLHGAKLSENELARRTGIPQQMINRMLSGVNKNPKIATLLPIAQYFKVTISQLIGEIINTDEVRLNTEHQGWSEISLITWKDIISLGITSANKKYPTVLTDAVVTKEAFAVKMPDNSMELKFDKGTVLIFESKKLPKNHDFALFNTSLNSAVIFRQILLKHDAVYAKCLNPKLDCFKAQKIEGDINYFGVLIQSKIDHA